VDTGLTILIQLVSIFLTGFLGYIIGSAKSFREAKQKAYTELLPPIIKMVYQPENQNDIKEFNTALIKLWLYASSDVAKEMEEVLKIIHGHGQLKERTAKLQEVIMRMREDIQFCSSQELNSKDLNHIYTQLVDKIENTSGLDINKTN
jgi:hypothetical protein